MKSIILSLAFPLLAALLPHIAYGQPGGNGFSKSVSHSHALIVGISDYAHIENLRFADRDARIFRDYLLQTMPTGADSSNIIMLLNEEAVSSAVYSALENLVTMAKEGDRVYIYFSGHGDSENTTLFRSGFLLTHDTPKNSYYTNSVNVSILDQFINTLSMSNKADVIFIADACRSGNIGQSGGIGMRQTARALAGNVADEVRLLSCQPDEISLESEEWGDGRGLFSYHLVRGMYGLADQSGQGDGSVILNELNLYLNTNVPRDADPVRQFPGVYGPMGMEISRVVPHALEEILLSDESPGMMTHEVESRGYEDQFVAGLQPGQLEDYHAFSRALTDGRLRMPEGDNALHFFNRLADSGIEEVFETLLRRHLATKLQEEAQLFIHQLTDVNIRWNAGKIRYAQWSEDLRQTAELLGPDHYMFTTIQGKSYFLSAADLYFRAKKNSSKTKRNMLLGSSLRLVDAAIQSDPLAAYYHNLKGAALALDDRFDEAIEVYDEAIRISPDYPYPYANKGQALLKKGEYEAAISELDRCIELDPGYTNAWQHKITALKKLGRDEEAMKTYRDLLEFAPPKGM